MNQTEGLINCFDESFPLAVMLFARMVRSASPTKIVRDEIVLVFEETSKAENSCRDKVWCGHFIQLEVPSTPRLNQFL